MKCPQCNNDVSVQDALCENCRSQFLAYPHIQQFVTGLNEVIRNGGQGFLKFTCLHCGSRQTFDIPNIVHTSGQCEACNGISDFRSPQVNLGLLLLAGTKLDVINTLIGIIDDEIEK